MIFYKNITYLIIFLIFFSTLPSIAQSDSTNSSIAAIVTFDSTVTIRARKELNVEDFIRLSRSDESLYKAFKRLRINSYEFETVFNMFSKKGDLIDNYQSKAQQHFSNSKRSMSMLEEQFSKGFYRNKKKKKPRYYTYELYSNLFYTQGEVKEEVDLDKIGLETNGNADLKGIKKQINELKKLIFAPGSETHVALIGNKTEIFSNKMQRYYNYSISKIKEDGQEYYLFSVSLKDKWRDKRGKTVIKSFVTYFETRNLEVKRRTYDLAYQTIAYQFDVQMDIELKRISSKFIPAKISYSGHWKIPFKKQENCQFNISFSNFVKPLL